MTIDFNVFISALTGAGLAAFIFKILEKNYEEHLLDKRNKKLSKQQLADEIIKICSEARSSNFKSEPRNIEHIEFIKNKTNIHDNKIGDLLEEVITIWFIIVKLYKGKKMEGIADDTYRKLIKNYQEEEKTLIKSLLQKIKKW